MLRAGKAAKPSPQSSWPTLGGSAGGGAWGSPSGAPVGSDESENEDRVPVPQFRQSFGDAIKAALDKHDSQPGGFSSCVLNHGLYLDCGVYLIDLVKVRFSLVRKAKDRA